MMQNALAMLKELCSHPEAFAVSDIKSGKTVTLYRIKALQAMEKKGQLFLSFLQEDVDAPDEVGLPYKKLQSTQTVRFELSSVADIHKLESFIFTAFLRCEETANLTPFGCCDLFLSCSDAGQCLRMDDPVFWGCLYRRNLEKGRIFYGKNKNCP